MSITEHPDVHKYVTSTFLNVKDTSALKSTCHQTKNIPYIPRDSDCATKGMTENPNIKGCPFTGSSPDLSRCTQFCGLKWKEWLPVFLNLIKSHTSENWLVSFWEGKISMITISKPNGYNSFDIYIDRTETEQHVTSYKILLDELSYAFRQNPSLKVDVYLQNDNQNDLDENSVMAKIWAFLKVGNDEVKRLAILQKPNDTYIEEKQNTVVQPKNYGFPNDDDYNPPPNILSLNNVAPKGWQRPLKKSRMDNLD